MANDLLMGCHVEILQTQSQTKGIYCIIYLIHTGCKLHKLLHYSGHTRWCTYVEPTAVDNGCTLSHYKYTLQHNYIFCWQVLDRRQCSLYTACNFLPWVKNLFWCYKNLIAQKLGNLLLIDSNCIKLSKSPTVFFLSISLFLPLLKMPKLHPSPISILLTVSSQSHLPNLSLTMQLVSTS